MKSSRIGTVATALAVCLGVAGCGANSTSPKLQVKASGARSTETVTSKKPVNKDIGKSAEKPADKPVGAGQGVDPAKMTKTNYDKVKLEMSEDEVRAVLGTPSSEKMLEDGKGRLLTWQLGTKTITATFRDGKLKVIDSQHLEDK